MKNVLAPYRCTVQPDWIDYNGHLSEAFYVLAFGYATDLVMDVLGLDAAYRKESGCSLYTVEAHVRYLVETSEGAGLVITTTILGSREKKLHLAHEMRSSDTLIATEEMLALHVDSGSGRTAPFPAPIATVINDYELTDDAAPPDWIGRAVSL